MVDHILMKPNGLGLEEVRPEDLLVLDLEGTQLAGDGPDPPGVCAAHGDLQGATRRWRRSSIPIRHMPPRLVRPMPRLELLNS